MYIVGPEVPEQLIQRGRRQGGGAGGAGANNISNRCSKLREGERIMQCESRVECAVDIILLLQLHAIAATRWPWVPLNEYSTDMYYMLLSRIVF